LASGLHWQVTSPCPPPGAGFAAPGRCPTFGPSTSGRAGHFSPGERVLERVPPAPNDTVHVLTDPLGPDPEASPHSDCTGRTEERKDFGWSGVSLSDHFERTER
jgi:hypothetical protein